MTLCLSSAEQTALSDLSTILLSPYDYDVDAWRSTANRVARSLLQGDCVSFMLPTHGGLHLYSDEWAADIPNSYPARVAALDREHGFWARQVEAGAWARHRLFTPAMYRSTYYREFVVPVRAFDAVGITAECSSQKQLAGILLHHTTRKGRRFGERGLQILRLMQPAFAAGVRMQQLIYRQGQDLARSIDKVRSPVFILTRAGRMLHANAAGADLIGRPNGTAWRTAIGRLTWSLHEHVTTRSLNGTIGTHRFTIDGATQVLDLALASPCLDGAHAFAIVSVRNHAPREGKLNIEQLTARYRLTPQECRVLILLSERRSNREVAETLSVSSHTARHHTENVLLKLGIGSRRDVPRVLAAYAAD